MPRVSKATIARALLDRLPDADRIAIGRELLTSTSDPALFPSLLGAARDVETAAVRLARVGFETEC